MIIGRSGEGATKLKSDIERELKRKKIVDIEDFKLDIVEVTNPDADLVL